MRNRGKTLGGVIAVLLLAGCTSTLPPRALRAAQRAASDPHTWAPLVAAVVFDAAGLDEPVARWAAREHPLFVSRSRAQNVSDAILALMAASAAASTAEAARHHPEDGAWYALAAVGAPVVAASAAYGLKPLWDRRRPSLTNDESFPSGHTTLVASLSAVTRQNLADSPLSPTTRRVGDIAFTSLTVLEAWSRIEAHDHYPSDVLAGMALGNFVGRFFHEFIVPDPRCTSVRVGVRPSPQGSVFALSASFDF